MGPSARVTLAVLVTSLAALLSTASPAALAQSPSPAAAGPLTASPGMSPVPGSPAPSGPVASGSAGVDACALLSPDELQTATGVALPAGTLQTADTRQVCQWSAGGVSVWLFVQPADPNIFENQKQTSGTPVTGVGDDAYSVAGPAQLYVLSGTTLVSVLVTGTTGDPAGIEVQLAQDALARL